MPGRYKWNSTRPSPLNTITSVRGAPDGILSYGNALVHLPRGGAGIFLGNSSGALVPGGKLAIQILNYDRILDNGIEELPNIDNDVVRFERRYVFLGEDELTFETSLTVKASGEVVENAISLYPLRPDRLEEMLRVAGFARVERFGNFKGEPFTRESYPLIVVATRA